MEYNLKCPISIIDENEKVINLEKGNPYTIKTERCTYRLAFFETYARNMFKFSLFDKYSNKIYLGLDEIKFLGEYKGEDL